MSDLYTDEIFAHAARAAFEIRDDPYDTDEWDDTTSVDRELYECQARAVLDAVAPAIAARALREAAEAYVNVTGGSKARPVARTWLRVRADEIERTH